MDSLLPVVLGGIIGLLLPIIGLAFGYGVLTQKVNRNTKDHEEHRPVHAVLDGTLSAILQSLARLEGKQ